MKSIIFLAAVRNRRHSVAAYFAGLVAAVLIPAMLIGGWLISRSAASERAQIEQNLRQKTREIVSDVDREIVTVMSMLTALASSHFLQVGDFRAFHRQALEVSRQLNIQIVVLDPQLDKQILSTAVPWGSPLPLGGTPEVMEAGRQALSSGKPVVSDVFVGRLLKQTFVAVGLPVMRNGVAVYVLSVGIPTEKFAAILVDDQLGPDRIAAVLDRKQRFVARSEKHDEFTGTAVAKPLPQGQQDVVRTKNRDGTPFCWFIRRSEVTGWVIGVGTPESVLEAPIKKAFASFGLAGGLLFVVAIGISLGLAGRISHSFGAMGIDRKPTGEEFSVLFESAPNGVLVVDGSGLIALVNVRIEAMFDYTREELVGLPVEFLIPERLRIGHSVLRQAFAQAPSARPMGAGRDLYGQRKDGSEFPIEIGLNPISTKAGNMVMATVVDISARKLSAERLLGAAEALRTSEDQRRLAVEAAELGTWTWSFVNDEIWWSDRLREILGVPNTMVACHTSYFERVHPADRRLVEGNKDRCLSGQRHYDFEYRIVRLSDQSTHWVNSKGRIDCDESGQPLRMHGVIQDITARRVAEHARDDLRRRLMQAHEDERLRLAHELHDQTGQSVAAIMMELKGIETAVGAAGGDRLRLLRKQLEQMGQALHRVARELRPASMDELGLEMLLGNYISEWGAQFGIDADFHCRDRKLDDLAEEIRTTIYRVIQEALTNIAKHATGSTSVSVVIDRVETVLQLTIEDNGPGFDLAAPRASERGRVGGLGLAGMHERLTLIGGELEIESSVGIGTTIFARIPLDNERLIA